MGMFLEIHHQRESSGEHVSKRGEDGNARGGRTRLPNMRLPTVSQTRYALLVFISSYHFDSHAFIERAPRSQ
jgi:hypothetical protein